MSGIKRIAIVAHKLTGGGAERVASLWANGFSARGYDVTVIIYDRFAPITYELDEGVKLVNIGSPFCNRWINAFNRYVLRSIPAVHRLRHALQEFHPDVVMSVLGATLVWRAAKGLGCRIIMTDHNSCERPADAPMKKIHRYEKFELSKKHDLMSVITAADAHVLGADRTNVRVMPNPVTFNPLPSVPKKEKVILAVSRFDQWYIKGTDLLIDAWGMVAKRHSDWKLLIAGTGKPQNIELIKQWINKADVAGQTNLLGFCTDMKQLYRKASVFVLSSRYEGFGMVLTEAMSQGCACITNDYKGRQAEIITSEAEGVVCPAATAEDLAQAINRILSDDALRNKLQHGGLKRSEYFTLEKTMDRWEEALKDLNIKDKE